MNGMGIRFFFGSRRFFLLCEMGWAGELDGFVSPGLFFIAMGKRLRVDCIVGRIWSGMFLEAL